jgi:hypothetical protein
MRILSILSGIAVLLTTIAYAHLLHHHLMNSFSENLHNAAFLAGWTAGAVVGVFALIGGCLLLKGLPRASNK